MAENQIRRIPVVDNNKVVGILTLGDLAKYSQKQDKKTLVTHLKKFVIVDIKIIVNNAKQFSIELLYIEKR